MRYESAVVTAVWPLSLTPSQCVALMWHLALWADLSPPLASLDCVALRCKQWRALHRGLHSLPGRGSQSLTAAGRLEPHPQGCCASEGRCTKA